MNRVHRHGLCFLLTIGTATAAALGGDPADMTARLSLLTAWLCFGFLVAALSVGPFTVRRTGRPLLNSLLRRDLGIWAGLTGLAHLSFATVQVMTPVYFRTYITGSDGSTMPGLEGWVGTVSIVAGYLVGLNLLLLLVLSSNRALQRLGPTRWKRLQRSAYLVFGLTAAHGLVFQWIEGRTGLWLWALVAGTGAVLGLQLGARRAVGT